jgi:hypothetical protein
MRFAFANIYAALTVKQTGEIDGMIPENRFHGSLGTRQYNAQISLCHNVILRP